MQNLNNPPSCENSTGDEGTLLRTLYDWALSHTQLCDLYTSENNTQTQKELKATLEHSLNSGKTLLESVNTRLGPKKPCMPISGLNRFNPAKELLNAREALNKSLDFTSKLEKTIPQHMKMMPMPSKNYIKKNNLQNP